MKKEMIVHSKYFQLFQYTLSDGYGFLFVYDDTPFLLTLESEIGDNLVFNQENKIKKIEIIPLISMWDMNQLDFISEQTLDLHYFIQNCIRVFKELGIYA